MLGLITSLAVVMSTAACSSEKRNAGPDSGMKSSAGQVFGQDAVGPLVDGIGHKTIKCLARTGHRIGRVGRLGHHHNGQSSQCATTLELQ